MSLNLLKLSPKCLRHQGLSPPANSLRRHQTHGPRRVRVRLRGRPRPPAEPRVAEHLRDVAASRAGLHGRRRGHAGRPWTRQNPTVCFAGKQSS